ncbi:MAG: ATP-binding protein [Oligoflexia bacterium]|nr:ATP-binding protein [Oligoflexia bacterium]
MTKSNHNLKLILPAILPEVSKTIEKISCYLSEHCPTFEKIMELELSIEEVLVNIVSYAYKDHQNNQEKNPNEKIEIELTIFLDNKIIKIEIVDAGTPFNPLEKEDANITLDVDQRDIGGLGVLLVKKLADKTIYTRNDTSNILTLEFKI